MRTAMNDCDFVPFVLLLIACCDSTFALCPGGVAEVIGELELDGECSHFLRMHPGESVCSTSNATPIASFLGDALCISASGNVPRVDTSIDCECHCVMHSREWSAYGVANMPCSMRIKL